MSKRYAYYLCQTKTCDHYGKSIRRDDIEGEVGALLKELQPVPGLFALATAMFRHAWSQRLARAKEARLAAKRQVTANAKEINNLLSRIMGASNINVIAAYEDKLQTLQREKALIEEKASKTSHAHRLLRRKTRTRPPVPRKPLENLGNRQHPPAQNSPQTHLPRPHQILPI